MINVGVVGISGYSGKILIKILLGHPKVRLTYVAAGTTHGALDDIHPEFKGKTNLHCAPFDLPTAVAACDLVFLATPHTKSMEIAPGLLTAKKKVIDLSADYRLSDPQDFEAWYAAKHTDPQNLSKAVYGLPELYREDIKKAQLIANPGCYPTAAILGLAPLIAAREKSITAIIIDAKSGVSGAGRKAIQELSFCEANENMKAYKVLHHQHTPEICAQLSKLAQTPVRLTFVPHLVPLSQGILETIYVSMNAAVEVDAIHDLYQKFYKTEKFVRVLKPGTQPEIKNVVNTNYCDIAIATKDNMIVVTSAIDNLVKGAGGQAVQNMNIMNGFEEGLAL